MELAFLLWPVFAILVGVFAGRRGRTGVGWFLLALLFSPLLAWLALLALGPITSEAAPVIPGPGDLARIAKTHVHCSECRELVLRDARKCKHCGSALVPQ